MFCDHDYISRTGMDSGSMCTKCGKMSDKEIDRSRSGGLNNGQLLNEHKSFLKIAKDILTPNAFKEKQKTETYRKFGP